MMPKDLSTSAGDGPVFKRGFGIAIFVAAMMVWFPQISAQAAEVNLSLGQQCMPLCVGGINSPCAQACNSIDRCLSSCPGPLTFSDCGAKCLRTCSGLCRSSLQDPSCLTACGLPVYAMMTQCMQSCPYPDKLDGCTGRCVGQCSASCSASDAPGCANTCTASLESMAAMCYKSCKLGDNMCALQCHGLCTQSCQGLSIPERIACSESCNRQNADMPRGDSITPDQNACLQKCPDDARGMATCSVECMGGKALKLPNPADLDIGGKLQLCSARCGNSPQTMTCMQECSASAIQSIMPSGGESEACMQKCQSLPAAQQQNCTVQCLVPRYATPEQDRQMAEQMVQRYSCLSQCQGQPNEAACTQNCLAAQQAEISKRYYPMGVPGSSSGGATPSTPAPAPSSAPKPAPKLAPATGGVPQSPIWR